MSPQPLLQILECVVGGSALGIPRDQVAQLIEYELAPLPSPAPYVGGLGVHAGEIVVSIAMGLLGTGRRRAQGVLLHTPGSQVRWAIEVSKIGAFSPAMMLPRDDARTSASPPRWTVRVSTAAQPSLLTIDVSAMIAELSAGLS